MGWFGWGEAAPARPESAAAAAIEQQIEMMDTVFMKYPAFLALRFGN